MMHDIDIERWSSLASPHHSLVSAHHSSLALQQTNVRVSDQSMERGTSVNIHLGGFLGKIYSYTPHYRIDRLPNSSHSYDFAAYKMAISVALSLVLLGFISFASCWRLFSWAGLPHICAAVFPYFDKILMPMVHLVYTVLVALFVFINFCGGLAAGCWPVPVLVELPMLGLSAYLSFLLIKADPELRARLKRRVTIGDTPAQPTMTTHPVDTNPSVGPSVIVFGTPVAGNKV